jgi:heparan-alpha-glucosaminide N-acetyltransferase
MADYLPLPDSELSNTSATRVASLDVFRGLCVFLMMVVDYAGSVFPIISHSPWNGIHLADFVMPFFLFIAGLSLALVYKKVTNRVDATWKALFRAVKLFLLGVLLQGGYLHGVTSLTYGVDIEKIRWMGVLQVWSSFLDMFIFFKNFTAKLVPNISASGVKPYDTSLPAFFIQ